MPKLLIFLISIGLTSNYCRAQKTELSPQSIYSWEFYDYLKKINLQEDALTWLTNYPDSLQNDSIYKKINLEISKILCDKQQYKRANNYLKKINEFSNPQEVNYAICLAAIVSDTGSIIAFLNKYQQFINKAETKEIMLSLKIIQGKKIDKNDIPEDSINLSIIKTANGYMLHKKKSPVLAGFLSALIPGLGKLYMGYKYQAVSAFTMNVMLDAVLIEYFCKSSGIIKWIIPLPLTALFYGGNILGTVLLAKKREIDFQNNLHEDIKTYYRNRLLDYK